MAVSTQSRSVPSLNAAAPLAAHPVVSEPPLEACLLLAQAVAHYGTRDWDQIAERLDASEHWPVEAGKMTSQGYAGAFDEIMRERGLDPQQCQDPLAAPARKLVHMLYSTLLSSLRQSILTSFQEEARLQEEIEAIRAGQRDEELAKEEQAAGISGDVAANVTSPAAAKEAEEAESGPETTPKKGSRKGAAVAKSASRATGGRSRRTPAGATTGNSEVDATAADVVEESVEPEAGPADVIKAEDRGDDDEEEASRAATADTTEDVMQVDDAGTVDGRDGDGDTAEGEDHSEGEDEIKPKRGRGRKGRASTAPKNKKRKQSEPPATSPPPAAGDDGNRKRKRVKTTEEPADVDDKDTKAAVQRRKVAFTRIIEQLQAERYSHYFESRVTRSIAPMYNVAVRRPTCLKDVLKAIKSGAISNSTELMRDVALLCANAIQFNGDEGEESVGYCAKLLWERFERLVDETLSTLLAADEA